MAISRNVTGQLRLSKDNVDDQKLTSCSTILSSTMSSVELVAVAKSCSKVATNCTSAVESSVVVVVNFLTCSVTSATSMTSTLPGSTVIFVWKVQKKEIHAEQSLTWLSWHELAESLEVSFN